MNRPDKRAARFGRGVWHQMDYYRGKPLSPRLRAAYRVRMRRSAHDLARTMWSFQNIRKAAPAINETVARLTAAIRGGAL